jgi:predicted membrane protein
MKIRKKLPITDVMLLWCFTNEPFYFLLVWNDCAFLSFLFQSSVAVFLLLFCVFFCYSTLSIPPLILILMLFSFLFLIMCFYNWIICTISILFILITVARNHFSSFSVQVSCISNFYITWLKTTTDTQEGHTKKKPNQKPNTSTNKQTKTIIHDTLYIFDHKYTWS